MTEDALAKAILENLEVISETDGGKDSTITFTHLEINAIIEALSAPQPSALKRKLDIIEDMVKERVKGYENRLNDPTLTPDVKVRIASWKNEAEHILSNINSIDAEAQKEENP